MKWSECGHLLASACGPRLTVWDAANLDVLQVFTTKVKATVCRGKGGGLWGSSPHILIINKKKLSVIASSFEATIFDSYSALFLSMTWWPRWPRKDVQTDERNDKIRQKRQTLGTKLNLLLY